MFKKNNTVLSHISPVGHKLYIKYLPWLLLYHLLIFLCSTLSFCLICAPSSNVYHVGLKFVTAGSLDLQYCLSTLQCGRDTQQEVAGSHSVVFFSTEQRKKYSNSNYIMHETSQYHVEVRTALFYNSDMIGIRKRKPWKHLNTTSRVI